MNIMICHNFRNVPWSCPVQSHLDVHVGQVHCGSLFAAVLNHWSSVLLPLPMLRQQLCRRNLKVLTADTFNASHV